MDVVRNRKNPSESKFCTQKMYTKASRQAGNAAVIMGDVVACWYQTIFLRCGAVSVMEFGKNIASLLEIDLCIV